MMQTLEAGDGFGECADLPHMVHELFRELFQEESFRPAFHRAGDDGLEKRAQIRMCSVEWWTG